MYALLRFSGLGKIEVINRFRFKSWQTAKRERASAFTMRALFLLLIRYESALNFLKRSQRQPLQEHDEPQRSEKSAQALILQNQGCFVSWKVLTFRVFSSRIVKSHKTPLIFVRNSTEISSFVRESVTNRRIFLYRLSAVRKKYISLCKFSAYGQTSGPGSG
jgi:hypothetical protein